MPLPAHRSLGESIEGDECSSRTASEAELGQPSSGRPRLSGAGGAGSRDGGSSSSPFPSPSPSPGKNSSNVLFRLAVGGGADDARGTAGELRVPPRGGSPASPVPTASSLAALARAATASTSPAAPGGDGPGGGFPEGDGGGAGEVYCSSPEESDFGDDEGGGGGGFEGGGSQAGFWYRDGGGASALEAAMGQWGDDDLDSTGGAEDPSDTGSDTTAPTVVAPPAGDGEDESWEIVNAPRHWEADATVSEDCFVLGLSSPPPPPPPLGYRLLPTEGNHCRTSFSIRCSDRTVPISFCVAFPPALTQRSLG